jgi:hypothetical protein
MFFFQLSCANEVRNLDGDRASDWFAQDPWRWFALQPNAFGKTNGAGVFRCHTSEWLVDRNTLTMVELGIEFKVSALGEEGEAVFFTSLESLKWDKLCLAIEDFSYTLEDDRLIGSGYMSFDFDEEEGLDGHPLVLSLDCDCRLPEAVVVAPPM